MAGAGWHDFVPGEVLTAANVQDYLQDQTVMKFASAAARAAALPSPSQGMMSFLNDTGSLETYYAAYNVSTNPGGKAAGAGWYMNGLNVASTVKTDTFSVSVAAGAISADITGLTVSLTPKTTTNKVLVSGSIVLGGTTLIGIILYRNGSAINTYTGDAVGSRRRVASAQPVTSANNSTINFQFLDSPASTSAQTYSVRLVHAAVGAQTIYVNRDSSDSDVVQTFRSASTITVLEVSA